MCAVVFFLPKWQFFTRTLAHMEDFYYFCARINLHKCVHMKNIAFIINPVSGSKDTQKEKRKLPKVIMQSLDESQWLPNITFTEYAGHATELARQYARMGFDAVVAVGGDGTVNEVAKGL